MRGNSAAGEEVWRLGGVDGGEASIAGADVCAVEVGGVGEEEGKRNKSERKMKEDKRKGEKKKNNIVNISSFPTTRVVLVRPCLD